MLYPTSRLVQWTGLLPFLLGAAGPSDAARPSGTAPATRPAEIDRGLQRVSEALSALPPEDRLFTWRHELRSGDYVARSWPWGDSVVFTTVNFATVNKGNQVIRLDASTGKQLKPLMDCTPEEARQAALVPLQPVRAERAAKGQATTVGSAAKTGPATAPAATGAALLLGRRVVLLDGRGGSREVQRGFDVRFGLMPYAGGFVAVEGQQQGPQALVRLDANLRDVWRREFPGYVETPPAVHGALMVMHTRGGYATWGIDLDTGNVLWKDPANAFGHGAGFSDDGSIVVESIQLLSPEATEARLVCRDPKSGHRIWETKRPGGISQPPVVGTLLNRVFAVFESGRVVCVSGRTGDVQWETPLPAPPAKANVGQPGVDAYRRALHLHENRLMVLDASGTLHWLDMETGRALGSAALAGYREPARPLYAVTDTPLAMPWLHGESLVVVTAHGINAYPLKHLAAGREPPELALRAQRVRLLIRGGDLDAAAAEVAMLRSARPASAVTFACAAELAEAKNDVEAEVASRIALLRFGGKETDPRLAALTGLVKRAPCGASPTAPLLVDGRLYVGSADGMLRAFSAGDLQPASAFDAGAAVSGTPALFDGGVVLPLESRRVIGVSADLKEKQFDVPQANPHGRYFDVGGRLLCSLGQANFAMAAALDPGRQRFSEFTRVTDVLPDASPAVHQGRIYYPRRDGGSASFDGRVLEVHPPVEGAQASGLYSLNVLGHKPVAYGAGGVFEVDEHLRPVKRLPGTGLRCKAACRGKGVVVTLSEPDKPSGDWLLEAWTDDGEKLPLKYAMKSYGYGYRDQPLLASLPGGEGTSFLLVGREVVSVDARRERPLRRFTPPPPGSREMPVAGFSAPAFGKDRVFVTHASGELYAFDTAQLLRPAAEPAPPAAAPPAAPAPPQPEP